MDENLIVFDALPHALGQMRATGLRGSFDWVPAADAAVVDLDDVEIELEPG